MIFFTCVSELVMTLARPTSEPVPAVVGTATIGAMAVGIGAGPPVADILEIPNGLVCPRMKATILPRSSPEPPPKAMTPSCRHRGRP
jgi:hypothetical protein